jgi:hypothetical protein
LKRKIKELLSVEGVAEFASQMKLLNQGVVNYLDVCDTPEKCEEFLTKVMIQIEELEGRFAEFDEFVAQLTEKREEIYNAFETRKLQLVEARNRRAGRWPAPPNGSSKASRPASIRCSRSTTSTATSPPT